MKKTSPITQTLLLIAMVALGVSSALTVVHSGWSVWTIVALIFAVGFAAVVAVQLVRFLATRKH